MPLDKTRLGISLRSARRKTGFSQEEAAFRMEVSRQTVSNWENGLAIPSLERLLKMREIYQISLDELVGE